FKAGKMAENCDKDNGAGEGNRTLVVSLGSFCSTIELHPRAVSGLCRLPARRSILQRADSRIVSIATKVEVLATCGRLEIFSPSTIRYRRMSGVRTLRR